MWSRWRSTGRPTTSSTRSSSPTWPLRSRHSTPATAGPWSWRRRARTSVPARPLGGGGYDKLETGGRHLYDEAVRVLRPARHRGRRARGGHRGRLGGGARPQTSVLGRRVAFQRQLRTPRVPPRVRHHGDAAGSRRPTACGGDAAHRRPTRRRGGLPDRVARPLGEPRSDPRPSTPVRDRDRGTRTPGHPQHPQHPACGLAERIQEATKHEKAEQARLSVTKDFAEGVAAMSETTRAELPRTLNMAGRQR